MDTTSLKDKSNLTFESAMQQLEKTVRELESGELPLSESIERYKLAMQLVQFCRQQLDGAELQIEQLMKDDSLKPMEPMEPSENQ